MARAGPSTIRRCALTRLPSRKTGRARRPERTPPGAGPARGGVRTAYEPLPVGGGGNLRRGRWSRSQADLGIRSAFPSLSWLVDLRRSWRLAAATVPSSAIVRGASPEVVATPLNSPAGSSNASNRCWWPAEGGSSSGEAFSGELPGLGTMRSAEPAGEGLTSDVPASSSARSGVRLASTASREVLEPPAKPPIRLLDS